MLRARLFLAAITAVGGGRYRVCAGASARAVGCRSRVRSRSRSIVRECQVRACKSETCGGEQREEQLTFHGFLQLDNC